MACVGFHSPLGSPPHPSSSWLGLARTCSFLNAPFLETFCFLNNSPAMDPPPLPLQLFSTSKTARGLVPVFATSRHGPCSSARRPVLRGARPFLPSTDFPVTEQHGAHCPASPGYRCAPKMTGVSPLLSVPSLQTGSHQPSHLADCKVAPTTFLGLLSPDPSYPHRYIWR